jgi:DNA invertase Pin-like site-specific DNA recombinase
MNAIIYSRVSTEDQDNQRAINELKDYAKYKKYKVLKVFEEKISGGVKAKDRTEFNNLLEFIKNNKVDQILVWELSRLGRRMTDVINTVEEFCEKGINIYCKKEGFNTLKEDGKRDSFTGIIIAVLSGFAEMERETFKAHSRSGIRANVARGGSGTGIIKAYGFKKVGKTLEVDENEAKIINMIFGKYLSGLGTMKIANYLNEKKIPTRFNKAYKGRTLNINGIDKDAKDFTWKDGTVYSILTNSIYKGDRKHKNEIFKVPNIVSEATYNEVQKRLENNYNKKGIHTKFEHPLTHLLKCGVCARSYYPHKRTNGKDNAYKCLSKRYNEYCGNTSINYDKLNDALFKICQPIIFSDAIEKPNNRKAIKERKDNLDSEIKSTNNLIDKLNNKLDKVFESYSENLIKKTKYIQYKQEIERQIEKSNQDRNKILKSIEELGQLANRTKELEYDYSVFKNHLEQAVEYIKIYPIKTDTSVYNNFKNDVCVMIEVKSKLDWLDDSPIFYHFILSRYSNIISIPRFKNYKAHDFSSQIVKGNFKIDFNIHLDQWLHLKALKNNYIKERGTTKVLEKYVQPKITKETITL